MSARTLYNSVPNGEDQLTVDWPYINQSYVKVYSRVHSEGVDQVVFEGVLLTAGVDYSWLGSGTIQLAEEADGLTDYLIQRETPEGALVTQAPGNLSSAKVNLAVLQALHRSEEANSLASDSAAIAGNAVLRALRVPEGETAPTIPSAADRANQFLAFTPLGVPIGSAGTGADLGLRIDLGDLTDPLKGAGLLAWTPYEAGAVAGLTREKLAQRITPEDYGAVGDGTANDSAAILAAANAAVARGQTLWGKKGARYRLLTGVTLPTGLHFDGEGCTFVSTTHINMITFLGGGVRFYNCKFEGPDLGVYNANGKGLHFEGTDSGTPGQAPNMLEDIEVEGVGFTGLGYSALTFTYARGVRVRDISGARLGYVGLLGFSCEDFSSSGFSWDTFYGESDSGELNAYAVTFTSQVNTGDHVRNPPSKRCYAHDGVVKNLPTWHALDTHGGEQIGFANWDLYDCKRAVALTNRGTGSPMECYVRDIRAINTLEFALDVGTGERTPGSLNSNGTMKKDAALWVIGANSSTLLSKRCTVERFYAKGHGTPGSNSGSFYFENTDCQARDLIDELGWQQGVRIGGGFYGNIERHQCINPQAWAASSYPALSWGNANANSAPRALDSTLSYGGVFTYEGAYSHPAAYETGVSGLDTVLTNLGVDHSPKLKGNGVRGVTGGGDILSGDNNYIRGNLDLEVILTGTGFSGTAPTTTCRQSLEGKFATLQFTPLSAPGTSNSTDFTLGTLNANFRPTATRIVRATGLDNGVDVEVILSIAPSGVITVLNGLARAGFLAVGLKGLTACSVSYTL